MTITAAAFLIKTIDLLIYFWKSVESLFLNPYILAYITYVTQTSTHIAPFPWHDVFYDIFMTFSIRS